MRRFFALSILLSVLSLPTFAAEKSNNIKRIDSLIAVFDFEVQGNIDKSIARSLAESVRIEIVNSGKYEVIDRSNMNKILKEQAFQMTGCVAKECAVEAGQMLGVGKIVVGTVGLIGKTYYLTLSVVNVETGKTEIIKDEECKCEVDALIASSKRVAKGLMGQPVPPQPQASMIAAKVELSPLITGAIYTDPVTGMEFVFVKGGCFLMGDALGDGSSEERPVHEVCLDDFYMGKYEVTEGQWKTILGNNSLKAKKGDNYPISSVSWDDVQIFVLKQKQKTGKYLRLPTEAEWEYAARSAGRDEKWAGINRSEDLGEFAWFKSGFTSVGDAMQPVGLKKPNGLGLHDMSGNVKEWVNDFFGERYYAESTKDNPKGPSYGDSRVLRGGSWSERANSVRVCNRDKRGPTSSAYDYGFRMVLQVK